MKWYIHRSLVNTANAWRLNCCGCATIIMVVILMAASRGLTYLNAFPQPRQLSLATDYQKLYSWMVYIVRKHLSSISYS